MAKVRPSTFSENGSDTAPTLPQTACRWCHAELPTDSTTCPQCCPRCGTKHSPGAGRCAACSGFLPGNQVARTHGLNARHVPADYRMDADQLREAIVNDLGGLDHLSALEISYVRKIADTEITLRLLLSDIQRSGMFSSGGRVRDTYPAFLAGLDRFDKLAQRVGLKRRTKPVEDIRSWWAAHSQPQEPEER